MNIIHYSLGLPPYRTGGLTKYVMDLVDQQIKTGLNVTFLYPAEYTLFKKSIIKPDKAEKNYRVFKLLNPLPVPLLGGISKPKFFFEERLSNNFKEWLKNENPDIIHIHTLMGLPKEFLVACREVGITTIFTTHDYYGLCPKVNLLNNNNEICLDYKNGVGCIECNRNSYSLEQIKVMQSTFYRRFKNSEVIKQLRVKINKKFKENKSQLDNHKHQYNSNIKIKSSSEVNSRSTEYIKFRDYSKELLNLIDGLHFNSSVAEKAFSRILKKSGKVINITHAGISDNRAIKPSSDKVRLGFLGPLDSYKGFFYLLSILDKIKSEGFKNWMLNVYGGEPLSQDYDSQFYKFHGKYSHNHLKEIMSNIDILVIPSIWEETFGFIGLEALSYGVPILVSEKAGVSDIVENNINGVIYTDLEKELRKFLNNPGIIDKLSINSISRKFENDIRHHANEINDYYWEVKALKFKQTGDFV